MILEVKMIGSVEDKKKSRRRLRGQKKNSVFWIAVKTEVKNLITSSTADQLAARF